MVQSNRFKVDDMVEKIGDDGDENDGPLTGEITTPSNDKATKDIIKLQPSHLNDVVATNDVDEHEDNLQEQHSAEKFSLSSSSSSSSSSITITDGDVIERLRSVLAGDADQLKLFQFAQSERRTKKGIARPYGIFGMFTNLSDIRSDLMWARDAAHRREHGSPYISWEDYYDKETKGLTYPYFTYTFMVGGFVLMLVAFHKNDWKVEEMKVNPMVGPSPQVLIGLGALESHLMIANDQWWRLLTPMFLHAGIIHLVLNMVAMLLLSRNIERNHGSLVTMFLFFVSGVCANILSSLMQPGYILVGASGGIFGLIGLCVADITLNWKLLFLVLQSRLPEGSSSRRYKLLCFALLVTDLFINSLVGFTPYVDNFAHMGGLVYGFLISCTMVEQLPLSFLGVSRSLGHRLRIYALRLCCAILSGSLILLSIILLSRSDGLTTPCPSCRYISCIPFPFWKESKWWYCDDCSAVTGRSYKRVMDDYYNKIDIYCPAGYTVTVNVFDEQFTSTAEISSRLPEYCRTEC